MPRIMQEDDPRLPGLVEIVSAFIADQCRAGADTPRYEAILFAIRDAGGPLVQPNELPVVLRACWDQGRFSPIGPVGARQYQLPTGETTRLRVPEQPLAPPPTMDERRAMHGLRPGENFKPIRIGVRTLRTARLDRPGTTVSTMSNLALLEG